MYSISLVTPAFLHDKENVTYGADDHFSWHSYECAALALGCLVLMATTPRCDCQEDINSVICFVPQP